MFASRPSEACSRQATQPSVDILCPLSLSDPVLVSRRCIFFSIFVPFASHKNPSLEPRCFLNGQSNSFGQHYKHSGSLRSIFPFPTTLSCISLHVLCLYLAHFSYFSCIVVPTMLQLPGWLLICLNTPFHLQHYLVSIFLVFSTSCLSLCLKL